MPCTVMIPAGPDLGAALVSNLCQHASEPQLVRVLSKDDAQRESHCSTSSDWHCQSDSDDWPDDLERCTEWKFVGHDAWASLLCCLPAGKTDEGAVRAAVEEQYLQTVPVPVYHMEMFYVRQTRQGTVETADLRLCTGKICEPKTVEEMDRCSFLGV